MVVPIFHLYKKTLQLLGRGKISHYLPISFTFIHDCCSFLVNYVDWEQCLFKKDYPNIINFWRVWLTNSYGIRKKLEFELLSIDVFGFYMEEIEFRLSLTDSIFKGFHHSYGGWVEEIQFCFCFIRKPIYPYYIFVRLNEYKNLVI